MRIEQHTSTLLSVTQRAPCNPQRVLGDLHDEMPCALSLSLTPLETIKHNDQICNESISHKTPLESIPERLQGYLATIEEPSGSQYQFWGQMFLSILRVSIHCGTPILRRWTKNGLEKHVNVPAQEGYAVVAILQCTKWVQARLSIRLIALYSRSSLFDLCLRCDIKGSTSFLFNGLHHRAIASGDFNHLQEAFSKKTLSPYDSTLDGDTLLHVSISLFRAEVFELKQIVACSRARSMRDHYFLDQGRSSGKCNERQGRVSPLVKFRVPKSHENTRTPLHISTKRGSSYECVRLLLSNGADISRQSKDGATPLHTFYNDTVGFVVHYYREHLDLSIQDFRGMTILHWISWTRKTTLADITVKIYPLVTAAQSPGINAAYNVRDNNGKTMIHYATERGNVPLVEFLLSQMKTLATSITDYSGCSLLHYAVGSSRVELIDRLLQQGLNLDSVDQDGKTVMHHAAMRGNLTAVKQLMNMNAGYQLSAEDKQGRTPFQLAETCGSQSVVDYLRSERSMWKPDAPRLKSAETGRSPPYVFRSSSKWTRPSLLLGMVSLIVIIFVGLSAFIHLWIRN